MRNKIPLIKLLSSKQKVPSLFSPFYHMYVPYLLQLLPAPPLLLRKPKAKPSWHQHISLSVSKNVNSWEPWITNTLLINHYLWLSQCRSDGNRSWIEAIRTKCGDALWTFKPTTIKSESTPPRHYLFQFCCSHSRRLCFFQSEQKLILRRSFIHPFIHNSRHPTKWM